LDTHLNSQFCIQVGERLVHQEYLRVTNDRTSHSNTLSLTTGKSLRFTVKQYLKIKNIYSLANLLVDIILRNHAQLQSECHVIIYCHMRIQSVVLEYHCDITVFRLYIVHYLAVDLQCTAGDVLESCNHTKCCRFTTS